MSKQTEANLFIVSSMPALYQQLLRGISNYEELATRILRQIKAAHAFRQTEKVRELSRILINIPIKEYRLIAQYYLVWCKCRELDFHDQLLERIAEQSHSYRTQALISRAAFDFYRGNFDGALHFYAESLNARPTVSEYLSAIKGIAVIKSLEGFGKSALGDLENLVPLLKYADPIVHFDLLNSYAVELGEVGRSEEARNVSRVVLASPFAHAYPEWRETAQELNPSRRAFVTVGSSHYNVLAMPEREHGEQIPLQPKPARVLSFAKGKKKMDKKDKDEKIQKSIEEMSFKDLGFKLLEVITTNQADEEQMRLIVAFAMSLFSEPSKPDPDKPAS
jgi:tetratricopeptide (TPR) repeat protein